MEAETSIPAGGTGEPPRERREEILRATGTLIARRGVRGLRVEEVASEAGVSPPLLYYHFGSRSGLVRAALEYAGERAPSSALRAPPEQGSGRALIEEALLAELDDDPTVRDSAVVWGEVSATAVFEPDLRDDVRGVADAWRDVVAATIRRGLADGSIAGDADPEVSAEILITLVDGLCNRWLAGALSRERARELLADAIARVLD